MAESGQGFGDPASVQHLAGAASQAASDLEKLTATVRLNIRAAIPGEWSGDNASWFQEIMNRLDRATVGIGSPLDLYGKALARAAETMERARRQLEAAQRFAAGNGLVIRPDLGIEATGQDRPGLRELMESAQQQVNQARLLAETATSEVYRANAILNQAATVNAQQFSEILGTFNQVNRRPRVTSKRDAKRDRDAYWRREEELLIRRKERAWLEAENRRHPEYRRHVEEAIGFPPTDGHVYVAHHNFPVALSGRFRAIGIDPENPQWASWARARDHEVFTPDHLKRWREFFDPSNPSQTQADAFKLARELANKHSYQPLF